MADMLGPLRHLFTAALCAGDAETAHAVVARARAAGHTPAAVQVQVIAPALVAAGELWAAHTMTLTEERLMLAIAEQLSADFLRPERWAAGHAGRVLVGGITGDHQAYAAQRFTELFRAQGWRVLDIGIDVPVTDWIQLARRFHVDACAISVGAPAQARAVHALITQLRAIDPVPLIVLGGVDALRAPVELGIIDADLCHPDPAVAVIEATMRITCHCA